MSETAQVTDLARASFFGQVVHPPERWAFADQALVSGSNLQPP